MNIYIKHNVSQNEFQLAHLTNKILNIKTPNIISYNPKTQIMISEKIDGSSVADFYGCNDSDTPEHIYNIIRDIITNLYKVDIIYPDITGYNFILDNDGNVWIIDFGHAYVKCPHKDPDDFVYKFINNFNGWNPEFK